MVNKRWVLDDNGDKQKAITMRFGMSVFYSPISEVYTIRQEDEDGWEESIDIHTGKISIEFQIYLFGKNDTLISIGVHKWRDR